MHSLLRKYQQRLEHQHGWQVELTCFACNKKGLPQYRGSTLDAEILYGEQPTVYANLFCAHCGKDLKDEAKQRLAELFDGVSMLSANRRILWTAFAMIALLPVSGLIAIWLGVREGLWGSWAFSLLGSTALLIAPMTMWCNYRIASIRHECPCGKPAYLFMGSLGRSYCYRCTSCGTRLRLRD